MGWPQRLLQSLALVCLAIVLSSSSWAALDDDYKFFYGISWKGSACDNVKYAKNMGYHYLMLQPGMKDCLDAKDMYFYVESPDYPSLGFSRNIDLVSDSHTASQISQLEQYFAVKSAGAYPGNMASGWFFSTSLFRPVADFQHESVIDRTVTDVLSYASSQESLANNFRFGGFAWDVPQLTGDFWAGGNQVDLSYWTGSDSGYPKSAPYDYSTYSDGKAAYYKQLRQASSVMNPDVRFIVEPYNPYYDWIEGVQDRADYALFKADLICQENSGIGFATDSRIFSHSGHSKQDLCSTTPNVFSHAENTRIAGMAAENGASFGWYGRFGGTGDMPDYASIKDVPDRLKLIRAIPGWENLNGVKLTDRHYDDYAKSYDSPLSHIDKDILYSTHPRNGMLYVVVINPGQAIEMSGKIDVWQADALFDKGKKTNSYSYNGSELILQQGAFIVSSTPLPPTPPPTPPPQPPTPPPAQPPPASAGENLTLSDVAASVVLEPYSSNYTVGDNVEYSIDVFGANDLAGMQVSLSYDPSVISFSSWDKGPFLGETIDINVSNTTKPGVLKDLLVVKFKGGVNGSGTLLDLSFVASKPGNPNIGVTKLLLSDSGGSSLNFTLDEKQVMIKAKAGKFKKDYGDFILSTKKSDLDDISNIDDLIIASKEASAIDYTGQVINLTGFNKPAVQFGDKFISVDSDNYPQLDKPATLTFHNIPEQYEILRNGERCNWPRCRDVQYSGGVLSFKVSGFSNYSIEGNGTYDPTYTKSDLKNIIIDGVGTLGASVVSLLDLIVMGLVLLAIFGLVQQWKK